MGSGAFGVGSVSAASVPGGVGGGTRSLGQTGSQGRQGRQGCWHTLVVIHPRNSADTVYNQFIFNMHHLWKGFLVILFIFCLKSR